MIIFEHLVLKFLATVWNLHFIEIIYIIKTPWEQKS